jgi:RimJ/RimL family protein N-acetyltransferase
MTARLRPLASQDVEQVRVWRDDEATRCGLRRPDPLTKERQQRWYDEVVCHPETSPHRYWAVETDQDHGTQVGWSLGADGILRAQTILVAQVSLESIDPHLKAEIGLITNPALRGQGIGREALRLLLHKAFDELGLRRAWGVCYRSNPALTFWECMVDELGGFWMADYDWTETNIWDGQEWPSRRFWFSAEAFAIQQKKQS